MERIPIDEGGVRVNTMPWSADEEGWRRGAIIADWICFWVTFVIISCGFWFHLPMVVLISFGAEIVWIWLLFRDRDLLEKMLQNKPRSTAKLTHWIFLRSWQTEIMCDCGTIVHIEGAQWYPNSVDYGGGRFAIVCPCGIGYFKLKEKMTSDW